MVSLRPEEAWVAGCVQAAMPHVTVGQHDDNRGHSVYDLDLSISPGRTFAAMEVTAAADGDLIACWRLLGRRDGRWIEPGLVGGWAVHFLPTASVKRLVTELPGLLKALENAGETTLPFRRSIWSRYAVQAEDLGVVFARQGPTDFPGSIYAMPEIPRDRTGGWVADTGDALSRWASTWITEASRADNLAKLRRSAANERHLAIIVPGLASTVPFGVTDILMRPDAPLPAIPPSLPAEVTHLWILGTWTNGLGFRWSPDSGWETYANDAEVDHSALVGCTC